MPGPTGPGAPEEGRFRLLEAIRRAPFKQKEELGLGRASEAGGEGWERVLLGEARRHDQEGGVQTPRGLVLPARVGAKEAQRGHGEVKEDEAQGGIPELIWLQASSFSLTMKRGPERRGKLGSASWGVRRRLFKCPSNSGQQRD